MFATANVLMLNFLRRYRRIGARPIYTPTQRAAVRRMARQLAMQSFRFTGRCDLGGTPICFPSLALGRFLFDEIFVGHEYFIRLPTDSPVILDCGANIGFAARYFKLLYPQARITCFEPNPSAFSVLQENTERMDNVATFPWALGTSRGHVQLATQGGEGSVRASTHLHDLGSNTITVELHPLSDAIKSHVDLLKLDIEGGETDVVQELIKSGAISRIRTMWIEYHLHCGSRSDFSYFLSLLERAGFSYQLRADFASSTMRFPFNATCQGINLLAFRVQ